MNPVSYFEIPVVDMPRAIAFYRSVFAITLESTTIDGNEMALFPSTPDNPGVTGALAKGESYRPSLDGSRLYFAVKDIGDTLARVVSAGGRVLYPKTSIGALGHVAEFEDCEGNRIALSSP
jgi:uncharacterized protein